jgi:hypothetical protein
VVAEVPAPSGTLVRDYLRFVGGDPGAYKGRVPAHLFPHWGIPLAAQTLRGLDYPLLRVMNGGCRLQMKAPLPQGQPLLVRARLESVDEDGRRAVLRQRVITGTASVPEAVVADIVAIVPLPSSTNGPNGASRARKEAARVPAAGRELAFWRLRPIPGWASRC